jgi:hypothetical protein
MSEQAPPARRSHSEENDAMDDPLDHVSDLEKDPSAIAADLDADGTADVVMGDENRDGQADWVLRREADGTSVAMVDTDASGSLETGFVDSDADGRFDAVTRDLDDDSVIDVTQLDSDRDGMFETMVLADETMITLDPESGLVTDVSREDARDPDRVDTTAPQSSTAPTTTPAPNTSVTPASPTAQPGPVSQPSAPAAAPAPVANEPAAQPAPPTTSSTTVAPGPAPIIATPGQTDPAPAPGPLVDEPDTQPAPPTTSSTNEHPGPPPPPDGSDPSQNPFPNQPGIGTDPAPAPWPLVDDPGTQTPPPTSSTPGEHPGPPPPSDGSDPSQNPFPNQPGIADEVVTDADTPGVPEPDPTAPADPAPQTPWALEQPGIGDDAAPYVEPIAEPEPVIDLIYGDGEAERQWGQIQTQNGYCGPVSIAMVLAELTGVQYGETQMVQAAIDRGMLVGEPGAWEGMYVHNVAALLTEFGAASHVESGTLDSLRAYLDQGRDIILFVDSSEVWYGTDDDGTAGDRQDHFLVITEIDDERGVATLNDPGWPTGVGREVSLATIEDAWQDSSYQMVVTDAGVVYGRADIESTTIGAAGGEPAAAESAHAGFIILPVVLSALALLPRPGADDASSTPRDK